MVIPLLPKTKSFKCVDSVTTNMQRTKFDEDDCIQSIKKASEKTNGILSQEKYRSTNISPSVTIIAKRCGSWNKAKKKAGLIINESGNLKKCPEILNISDSEWKNMNKSRRFRKRLQAKAAEIKKEKGCRECNYNDNPVALTFHHPDDNKKGNVSTMIQKGKGKKKILSEIKKCEVLCSNCHKIIENGDSYTVSVE